MTDLQFSDTGTGPAVLILHGVGGAPSHFEALVEPLARSHRVLVPHLPGYGSSPPLEGRNVLARAQRALEEGLLERGVTSLAGVIGYSLGAYRALALALGGGIAVERVIALAGVAGLDPEARGAFRESAHAFRSGVDMGPAIASRALAPSFARAHRPVVSEVASWFRAVPAETLAGELDAVADSEDLRPRLRELTAPVVARVGSLDLMAPPAWSEEIARLAPRGRLEVVEGCGHALLHEDREGTVSSVLAALGCRATQAPRDPSHPRLRLIDPPRRTPPVC